MTLLIALIVALAFALIAVLIGIMLNPKQHHDHYSRPFGDVPKVPHG